MWFAKNPDGSRVFNHRCLWVDQTGMLIQSLADVSLGTAFEGLAIQFATPEAALADAERRTRTILELHNLYPSGASVDEKHRCGGIIRSVESRSPWYKIQLFLRDSTGEAPFIIFGPTGNNLVFTSAHLLAQKYPHRTGQLPPEMSNFIGQFVRFEVKLPMMSSNGLSTGEFRVFRVLPQDNKGLLPAVVALVQIITGGTQGRLALQGMPEQCGVLMLTGPTESLPVSSSVSYSGQYQSPLVVREGAGAMPLGPQSLPQPISSRTLLSLAMLGSVVDFMSSCEQPSLRSSDEVGKEFGTPQSKVSKTSSSSGAIREEFGTPQSKISKTSSTSTPSSSPSANLLVSPLAKDDVWSSGELFAGTWKLVFEELIDSSVIMTPRKKPTTNKVLKRKWNDDSLSSGITDVTPSAFPPVLRDNTRMNKKSRQLPFMLSAEDTELSGYIGRTAAPQDPYTTHMEGQTSRQNPPSLPLERQPGPVNKKQNWILAL
ncbi:unnamed protein product [Linum tenue]|uniref:Uncharacterized protein n=1 Tax=Linum tenue TaxID=586396 RepID=A0AAV0LLJ4_9ROSI|nr:unnamed protein product [Linum tenue]